MAWCIKRSKQTSGQNIKGENIFENGAHWRLSPVGCVKAALQNKSVVYSGSRVSNSTVMKLLESDNRGGITVNTCTKSTCSHKDKKERTHGEKEGEKRENNNTFGKERGGKLMSASNGTKAGYT